MAARTSISTRRRFEIFKRDGFRCRYCGRTSDEAKLHVDHVDPVALGGSDDDANLVTACSDCNLGKAAIPLSAAPPSGRLCGVCRSARPTDVHLVPYASPPCEAVLACASCDPGGYPIPLAEWFDPALRIDWKRHLFETKNDGWLLVDLILEALG